ncbi:uncharacterized protein LOC108682628 [Hyalella azteca]|uniref:Translation initiation factor eIF2B subunit beta n=1 Tax=Hyalella azteca TaxID=294128 RepID=A0A8B7PMV3_HYAAZ|nr:uncharacterized protein LOC108682628 [Hyalella azteca]
MGKKSPKNSPKKSGMPSKSSPATAGSSSEKKSVSITSNKGVIASSNSQYTPAASDCVPSPKLGETSSGVAALDKSMERLSIDDRVKVDTKVVIGSKKETPSSTDSPHIQNTNLENSIKSSSTHQKLPIMPLELDNAPQKSQWSVEEEMDTVLNLIDSIYYVSEHDKALATFDLIRGVISEEKQWKSPREMIDRIMTIYAEITAKVPYDTTSRNVILKLRKIILDEFREAAKDIMALSKVSSTSNFMKSISVLNDVISLDAAQLPTLPDSVNTVDLAQKVKENVLALMMEYKMELENIPTLIVNQAKNIIVEDDVVMTHSYCPITAQLFINAARHCNYTLYVVESQPLCYGHLLLDDLRGSEVNTILIPDCNVGALMPKMTKVIMPCSAILADGSVKTLSFGGVISHVAMTDKKEVYVIAANYQFTPSLVSNVNLDLDPLEVDSVGYSSNFGSFLKKFDLTDCTDVCKHITNTGAVPPAQASRVMADMYNPRLDNEEPLSIV